MRTSGALIESPYPMLRATVGQAHRSKVLARFNPLSHLARRTSKPCSGYDAMRDSGRARGRLSVEACLAATQGNFGRDPVCPARIRARNNPGGAGHQRRACWGDHWRHRQRTAHGQGRAPGGIARRGSELRHRWAGISVRLGRRDADCGAGNCRRRDWRSVLRSAAVHLGACAAALARLVGVTQSTGAHGRNSVGLRRRLRIRQ